MNAPRLLVFLKAPRPGFVKTRLARDLDAEAAAGIHRVLVERTLARVAAHPDVELRFAPDDAESEVKSWQRAGWRLRPQGPGDLGTRLSAATAEAFAEGSSRVLVIGSDCPDIEREDLRAAEEALSRYDVVLGPAEDGGYWLLGLRAPQPALFRDIAWGTSTVLTQTCERARSAGLEVHELRRLRDIDTLEDWRAWLRSGFPAS